MNIRETVADLEQKRVLEEGKRAREKGKRDARAKRLSDQRKACADWKVKIGEITYRIGGYTDEEFAAMSASLPKYSSMGRVYGAQGMTRSAGNSEG